MEIKIKKHTSLNALPVFALVIISLVFVQLALPADCQDYSSDRESRKKLFSQDAKKEKEKRESLIEEALSTDEALDDQVNITAPKIEYLKESNEVHGSGGALLDGRGVKVQAEEATFNNETKEAELKGDIVVTTEGGSVFAEEGTFNFDSEQGEFRNANFTMENGAYNITGVDVNKYSETEYSIKDFEFTTCHCPDGDKPWSLESSRCNLREEGYAHTYGTTGLIAGIPLIYLPYFAFPVKTERASGLLAPDFERSSRDGFIYRQPILAVVDESTDFVFTPFVESRTRVGSFVDYHQVFSTKSKVSSRLIYSNEELRGDSLRGAIVDDMYDHEFDQDRFGGYHRQLWRSDSDVLIPSAFVTDLRYVSDDLLVREIDNNSISNYSTRFVTSTASFRSSFGNYITSELSSEYNQAIQEDDDFVFQRLPEYRLNALKSFRPFGYNPLGAKVVTRGDIYITEFDRQEGYDGTRVDLRPRVTIPFHYKNYLATSVEARLNQTNYALNNTQVPGTSDELDSGPSRTVPTFTYNASTIIERVFESSPDSFLGSFTSLGATSGRESLRRIKNTIEPAVQYTYVPDVSQEDLPFFDDLDRIRARSLFVYGVTTRLYGRMLPESLSDQSLVELTPQPEDLSSIQSVSLLDDMGGPGVLDVFGTTTSIRQGSVREIANLTVREGYDFREASKDLVSDRNAFTDTLTMFNINPTKKIKLGVGNTFNREDSEFTSWYVGSAFQSDRGDGLRVKYNFVDESLNQIELGTEVVFTDRVRVGYFTRYDEMESSFIENLGAVRLMSSCDCWHLDLGYSDRINPDRQKIFLSFTFTGLGDITQDILTMPGSIKGGNS